MARKRQKAQIRNTCGLKRISEILVQQLLMLLSRQNSPVNVADRVVVSEHVRSFGDQYRVLDLVDK